MHRKSRPRGHACTMLLAAASLLGLLQTSSRAADPAPVAATGNQAMSACAFVGDTLIPRLAMGVRRLDGDDLDFLPMRRSPEATTDSGELPLFRPYFIAESKTDPAGETWHLLQEGYVSPAPLGWARGRHLHVFDSRYAYTFASHTREQLADLHDDAKEAYERLLAQIAGNPEGGENTVVVRERNGAETWDPLTIDDIVPFVELRVPPDQRNREYPDTTPTFRFGIPVENRLVHMGAICGGPVDKERLRDLKMDFDENNGLEMLFVVDETTSMDKFMKEVAKFVQRVGELAVQRPVPTRIAVCSYTDGPDGAERPRVRLGAFETVKKPGDVTQLVTMLEKLGFDLPPDPYNDPPERMLEGLRDSLKGEAGTLDFQRGAALFVAVIGDKGHRPRDPDRKKLITEIADLVERRVASVYFMHVGARSSPEEKLFVEDFRAVARAAGDLGVPGERVVYQPVEQSDLQNVLEKARDAVEQERRRLKHQIARMESRSPYTEPGPKLLAAIENRGLDRTRFDNLHLQYFVPSRGWLFHPTSKEAATAKPQLRELFLLSPPEREAVKALFDGLRNSLTAGDRIDGDTVIRTLGRNLAAASGNNVIEGRVLGAWNRIPTKQRSVGVFMEDVFGLRLKTALPFPPIDYVKEKPATRQEIERMLERIGRLGAAFQDDGPSAFWFDAAGLTP
jgi:hypothetical protein